MRNIIFKDLSGVDIIKFYELNDIKTKKPSNAKKKLTDKNSIIPHQKDDQNICSENWQRFVKIINNTEDFCCANDCFHKFDKEALMNFAYSLDTCSKGEQETALLMNMLEHSRAIDSTQRGSARKRQRVMYNVPPFGSMCREAFLWLWGKGEHSLRNLRKYQTMCPGRFSPRKHGNADEMHHSLPLEVHQAVIGFINQIANDVGEESEGRNMHRNNFAVEKNIIRFLPTFYSVALLYRLFLSQYRDANSCAVDKESTPISLRQFYNAFSSSDCESVQLRSPRSDVCDICLLYRNKIRRDCNIVDENDEEDITLWNEHVTQAKEARNVYRNELLLSQEGLVKFIKKDIGAEDYIAHITFDFAQNLGLPQLSNPPQEIYFTSLRSVQLFSIRDDGAGHQYNFLYDEGDGSKGGNYVASMLILFLLDLSCKFGIKRVLLHADNCCSQNKNNMILWSLEWLVMIGIFEHIELKFLIKGHTHCSVDGGHGLIKKEWRKRDAFSIQEVKKIIEDCSPTQHAIILSSNEFFNWSLLLEKHFQKLPGITSQQEFEFDRNHFGIVRYRSTHSDKWKPYRLLKAKKNKLQKVISSLPAIQNHLKKLTPPGISLKKQWNLYKKMRKYVPEEFKDILCPKPYENESIENC